MLGLFHQLAWQMLSTSIYAEANRYLSWYSNSLLGAHFVLNDCRVN